MIVISDDGGRVVNMRYTTALRIYQPTGEEHPVLVADDVSGNSYILVHGSNGPASSSEREWCEAMLADLVTGWTTEHRVMDLRRERDLRMGPDLPGPPKPPPPPQGIFG